VKSENRKVCISSSGFSIAAAMNASRATVSLLWDDDDVCMRRQNLVYICHSLSICASMFSCVSVCLPETDYRLPKLCRGQCCVGSGA